MNLTSPSQVKAWCIENGFHTNKVLYWKSGLASEY